MRRQLWLDIRALRDEGLSVRGIARRLCVHRRTVRGALASDSAPTAASRTPERQRHRPAPGLAAGQTRAVS
jgi:IS30 family transposase